MSSQTLHTGTDEHSGSSTGTPATRKTYRNRRLPAAGTVGRYAALAVAAALTLGPVLWTLSTSLRTPSESFNLPPSFLPLNPDFTAYQEVFKQINVGLLVLNSALVTGLIALGQMASATLAGYAFARLDFRGRKAIFSLVLATMMVPVQVTIVPVFMLIRGMGLSDTLLALILPAIPTAFGTFLMRQYFLGLPNDFAEAAALDGAGPWRIFRSVYAPLAVPGMAIVGILAFNFHWNEFFRPLILTISEQNFTLPLGLVTLQGNLGTGSISVVLAGVILSMLPALVVFIFGQRTLREGLTAGASK
ncbi:MULTISPECIES: carbohydrate ABC transporter permease [Pseudarthrobacter]|uniref:Sugar ABC transporter permease n=1 Tax=Pseudarthrobacter polychromogenes TaxID=1676 RepID=A0ABQ1XEM6_9MICC|nr:carbohydrate ABC transporter permease [Pseudarthrobacter polychromogenes]MBD1539038.1 carbohydrate ABC transporter permease [Arthrobacter sp. S13_S34]MBD1591941.1 carbohydrate ABC transporter permease [Arthrobacter sp. S1_S22]GGG87052.1 sugar ABC transporter permease [Pseudarthrobacter polychromogenes]